jgi:hypothetical protein
MLRMARWAAKYNVGYMELVGVFMEQIPADLSEEVAAELRDREVLRSTTRASLGGEDFYPVAGSLTSNRYLHKEGNERAPARWARAAANKELYDARLRDEPDEVLYKSGTTLTEAKVQHIAAWSQRGPLWISRAG